MRALLIAGGNIDIMWAGEFVKMHKYDRIIAVDGGLSAANLLGLCPDMIVGDFDTVSEELLSIYTGLGDDKCEIVRLNPEKDDTDTQCAMNRILDAGAKEIHILGGTGSRIDHTMSNIYMLKMAYERGAHAVMYDKINKISVIAEKTVLYRDEAYGKYISFMQLEGPVRDVTLEGFKYNVEHFEFDTSREYRMAVSNEFAGEKAVVDMAEGMFIVMEISGD